MTTWSTWSQVGQEMIRVPRQCPSYPERRANFSYFFLQKVANRFHKQQNTKGDTPTRIKSDVFDDVAVPVWRRCLRFLTYGDGNGDVKKAIGLMTKATTLHVHYTNRKHFSLAECSRGHNRWKWRKIVQNSPQFPLRSFFLLRDMQKYLNPNKP